MNYFQEPNKRYIEVIVGLITSCISILFVSLLVLFLVRANFDGEALLFELILGALSLWFGLLSYRLLMNKPTKDGGLLSSSGLKIWSIMFGISSIIGAVVSAYNENVLMTLNCIFMVAGCLYGVRIANNRAKET